VSSFAERQGDFEVEPYTPTPDEVLRMHDLDPASPREEIQARVVERWEEYSEEEREILSEADYI
jgi:hypothetical protein